MCSLTRCSARCAVRGLRSQGKPRSAPNLPLLSVFELAVPCLSKHGPSCLVAPGPSSLLLSVSSRLVLASSVPQTPFFVCFLAPVPCPPPHSADLSSLARRACFHSPVRCAHPPTPLSHTHTLSLCLAKRSIALCCPLRTLSLLLSLPSSPLRLSKSIKKALATTQRRVSQQQQHNKKQVWECGGRLCKSSSPNKRKC